MDNILLQQLAKRLNLTDLDFEKEEYILTKEEEDSRIAHEISEKKKHKQWKFEQMQLSQEEILKRLSEIDWESEINREEILAQANSSKHQNKWHKQLREKEKAQEEEEQKQLQTLWTAKNILTLMKWTSENTFGKKLIIHHDNTHLITAICFFLSNDKRFETDLGYSFKKGLLIRGVAGLGKTYLVKCVAENGLNPVLIESMIEINDEVKREGAYQINISKYKILYLDDVGTEEPVVNHYGTKISFFKNFIEMYYLQNKPFNKLMISTNNSFSEMEDKYGFRVRSRVKDMFNIVDVSGKDMRG